MLLSSMVKFDFSGTKVLTPWSVLMIPFGGCLKSGLILDTRFSNPRIKGDRYEYRKYSNLCNEALDSEEIHLF